MYKVYKMFDVPCDEIEAKLEDEDIDYNEVPEVWGGYTNYEYDIMDLPDINDKIKDFNKLVGYENMSDDDMYMGRVIYWCESFKDLLKAVNTMNNRGDVIGGIDEPVNFDYHGKEYVYDIDEISGNAIVIPTSLENEVKRHLDSLDEDDDYYDMFKSIYEWTFLNDDNEE